MMTLYILIKKLPIAVYFGQMGIPMVFRCPTCSRSIQEVGSAGQEEESLQYHYRLGTFHFQSYLLASRILTRTSPLGQRKVAFSVEPCGQYPHRMCSR